MFIANYLPGDIISEELISIIVKPDKKTLGVKVYHLVKMMIKHPEVGETCPIEKYDHRYQRTVKVTDSEYYKYHLLQSAHQGVMVTLSSKERLQYNG